MVLGKEVCMKNIQTSEALSESKFRFLIQGEIVYHFWIILIILITTQIFCYAQKWEGTSGPSGGEVNKIIIHPFDTNIIYATVSLPYTSVFKTTNSGKFWEALTDGLGFDYFDNDLRWINDIAIDVSYPETLYASIRQSPSIGSSFLYRSINGGESWEPIKEGIIYSLYVDAGKIYALSNLGLLYSSDAGSSWVVQNSSIIGNRILLDDDNNILWISSYEGLYRSDDGGVTFQQFTFNGAYEHTVFDVAIVNNQKLVALSVIFSPPYSDSLFLSYDEGATWINRSDSSFSSDYEKIYAIKISRQNIDHIYIGFGKGFYKTTNAGLNWEEHNSGLNLPHALLSNYNTTVTFLAISHQNPNIIFAGTTNDGIYSSIDEGNNWEFVSLPSGKTVALSAAYDQDKIVAASTGGIYCLNKNGIWQLTTMLIGQIIGNLTEVAVSPYYNNLILNGYVNSIRNPLLYKSNDNGLTWDLKLFFYNWEGYFYKIVFDPKDSETVYTVYTPSPFNDDYRGLMVSTDQGDSWENLPIPRTSIPIDIAINLFDNKIIYILRVNGSVDKSEDMGLTWNEIRASIDSQHTSIRIDPIDPDIIYIGSFWLFKSNDGGKNWIRMPFDKKVTDIVIDDETGELFIGTFKEGVWHSSDGGNNFNKLPSLPSERITSLIFYRKDKHKKLFVGTEGVGVYKYDLTTTSINESDITLNKDFRLYQNYPNPFNPFTKISYEIFTSTNVTMEIIDILGKKVKTLVQYYHYPGNYSVYWNGKDDNNISVSSGVYFYILRIEGYVTAKKMVYIR